MTTIKNGSSVEDLLDQWEEVYKKGLLTFWILLLLHERPAYPYEMSEIIRNLSLGRISADDNSLYRALSRFEGMGIVESEFKPSENGPDRKYFTLNEKGMNLLNAFIQRNILIFQSADISERIQSVLNSPRNKEREP
jgi:PadR family transcriptional regulator PadR